MEALTVVFVLLLVCVAFVVSAAAGLGGSLVLVPGLVLLIGSKSGAALAALLLASNNVVKIAAYRRTLPFRPSVWVVAAVVVGAAIGARLLVAASERAVALAVIASIAVTFLVERMAMRGTERRLAPVLAFGSGVTSGFSGTSGPLKGIAIRSLQLDRLHLVGAASLVSFAGDATKTATYAEADLIDASGWALAVAAVPLMIVSTFTGRRLNQRLGERGYACLFWSVMGAYSVRLAAAI
jgi:uncharacterized membrane protein YfcA